MGFLLRADDAGIEVHTEAPGALTTLRGDTGGTTVIVHGDLLDPAFTVPAGISADVHAGLGPAFARYCAATVTDDAATLWTDHGALCPLLYTRDRTGALLVATSAAALLARLDRPVQLVDGPRQPGRTGFAGVSAVPAGTVVTVPLHAHAAADIVAYFPLPTSVPMPAHRAVRHVGAGLTAAVAHLLRDRNTAAVLLSGGVDSSTVAALARPHLTRLSSYTVGTCYGDEFGAARQVATLLGTEHTELLLTAADLDRLLPRMIRLLETWQLDTLRIAAPMCFALDQVRGREDMLLTGYGADLLFAGLGGDVGTIEQTLRAGVTATGCSNEFSPALAEDDRILVRHPYWAADMITAALTVPARWKLRDGTVKWVLRQVAAQRLPAEVAHRPKLAIQDGTAMHRLFADVLGTGDAHTQTERLRRIADTVFTASHPPEGDTHAHLAGLAT